jgi:tripartite-type tricarboxylate transporter receptor subunit TctC
MSWTRRQLAALLAAAGAFALSGAALAQNFPSKPITLVVPFAAGGPSDTIARLVGEYMSRNLGQQVVIENVAGAGGTVGATRLARAEPDGHTLLIHHLALAAAPALYKNLPYETKAAFEPVGLVNTGPMVLVTRKALDLPSPKDLFAYLRKNGDRVTMAHAGVGSNSHLCSVLLTQALGFSPSFVPYKGTGPALNDLAAGQVEVLCDQSTTAVPQITGGTVKAYVVTSKERLDVIKDVPTAIEAGLPEFEMTIWHGLYAPKGTPKDRVAALNAALQKALAEPAVADRFKDVGTTTFGADERTPEAHGKRFLAEVDRWARVLKNAGVQTQ